ncbi:hypothetical protein N9A86_00295 [Akkermansiaceae bacterium]|nr:hypothetical protein [Akkermansiaceae bacterium]
MSSKQIALVAIAVLFAFGSYFYWKSRPEQQINKQIKSLVETVEYRRVSLDNREARHETLRKVFAEKVSFEGSPPVPDGEMGIDTIIKRLDLLHTWTSWVEITEIGREILIRDDDAQVRLDWSIKAAAGQNNKRTENWTIVLDFEESDGEWKITHLNAQSEGESAASEL